MSSTLKQAIQALKSRIADAYTAIVEKGGTLPATQDSASLPAAIESIPAREEYDIMSGIWLSDDPSDPSTPTGPLPDGVSLLQLLCSTSPDVSKVTKIVDYNVSWTMKKKIPFAILPSVQKLHLGCKECYVPIVNRDLTEFSADHMEYFENNSNIKIISGITSIPKLTFPALKKLRLYNIYAYNKEGGFIFGCSGVEEVDMPVFEEVTTSLLHVTILCDNSNLRVWNAPNFRKINQCEYLVYDCPALEIVRFGTLVSDFRRAYNNYKNNFVNSTSNLVHFEICADGGKLNISLHLNWWEPTNVLADQDLLQQFLLNFREFIFLRLANRKSATALTIILSAAVYTALTSETRTLADLGITASELTDAETAAGITTDTAYNSWLDTYRAAINWNFAQE